jgi:hypothetical protein
MEEGSKLNRAYISVHQKGKPDVRAQAPRHELDSIKLAAVLCLDSGAHQPHASECHLVQPAITFLLRSHFSIHFCSPISCPTTFNIILEVHSRALRNYSP